MKDKKNSPYIIDEESQQIIDHFYKSIPTEMSLPDGRITEVPKDGNLGLLALGYKGIIAWRKKREQVFGIRLYSPFLEALKKYREEKGKLLE